MDGLITVFKDGIKCVELAEKSLFRVNSFYGGFNNIDENEKSELFKTIYEYISTPIEEREEKKRYRYRLKDIADTTTDCHKRVRFLNYYVDEDAFTVAKKMDSARIKQYSEKTTRCLKELTWTCLTKSRWTKMETPFKASLYQQIQSVCRK